MRVQQFFIVGAQRCGTTFLASVLKGQEGIQLAQPEFPEPKYFLNPKFRNNAREAYSRQFYRGTEAIKVEKSTSYYEVEHAAISIHQLFPNAGIIFCVRNPIERALSNYFFSVNKSLETRSLEQVFLEQKEKPTHGHTISVDPFNYLGRGIYSKSIRRFQNIFGEKQVLVLVAEDLFDGNVQEWKKLSSFMAIPVVPPISGKTIESSRRNASERNSIIPDEVLEYLSNYYSDEISSMSELVGRKLPWL